MHPKLFEIPFLHLTVWTYGFMMALGFISAIGMIRHLSRKSGEDPTHVTNGALYTLIAGVVGARLFYVFHYWDSFKDSPLRIFAVWEGGLEQLGGFLLAIVVVLIFMRYHKLPIRKYLDILAIGFLLAVAFGRTGCFFRGCCYGKPTDCPVAIRFPYGKDLHSPAYYSQVTTDPKRGRTQPHLHLPDEYFGYFNEQGQWIDDLKPWSKLTDEQKEKVTTGEYRCLPVHPTQLYDASGSLLLALLMYLYWRRNERCRNMGRKAFLSKYGCVFAAMLMLQGPFRFFLETLRDDNPFENAWWIVYKGGTISQNISIYTFTVGCVMMLTFALMQPIGADRNKKEN